MVRKAAVVSLSIAAMLAVVSCGRNTSASGTPPTTSTTDSAVTAVAAAARPVLRTSFADTFAGLELRHEVPMSGVRVEFRDAKCTATEMEAAGARVMDDREYWKGRGATVVAVAPAVDGSGVEVITSNEAGDLVGALRERYPAMSFRMRTGGDIVFPMYTGPPLIWSGPPPHSTK